MIILTLAVMLIWMKITWCWCQQPCHEADADNNAMMLSLAMSLWCWWCCCWQLCHDADAGNNIVTLMLAVIPWQLLHNNTDASNDSVTLTTVVWHWHRQWCHDANVNNDAMTPMSEMILWEIPQWCHEAETNNNVIPSTPATVLMMPIPTIMLTTMHILLAMMPWHKHQRQYHGADTYIGSTTVTPTRMPVPTLIPWCWC